MEEFEDVIRPEGSLWAIIREDGVYNEPVSEDYLDRFKAEGFEIAPTPHEETDIRVRDPRHGQQVVLKQEGDDYRVIGSMHYGEARGQR